MKEMSFSAAARAMGGELIGADASFGSVSTDTRKIKDGDLFFALTGPRYDGHAFLEEARSKGASAAVVSQFVKTELPVILVDDTRLALGRLAGAWRDAWGGSVIAVTGSNGKTTVKEMIAAILQTRGTTLATQGNLNNDIGVPLTLLRLQETHRYAVVEMGANHAGEIAYLSRITRPGVALITNAGPAHLEGFGSIEGVARAKGEIFSGLGANGIAIINNDDAYAGMWHEMNLGRRCVSFSLRGDADVALVPGSLRFDMEADACTRYFMRLSDKDIEIRLKVCGKHNVANALAAAAAALAAGADETEIAKGLAGMKPVQGRLQIRAGLAGLRIIDDTYNANPGSLAAALEVLALAQGEKLLALGDMGELGESAVQLHADAGLAARAAGVTRLYATGELSRTSVEAFGEGGLHFTAQKDLIKRLRTDIARLADAVLLVKGSRRMQMERVVEALLADAGEGTGGE